MPWGLQWSRAITRRPGPDVESGPLQGISRVKEHKQQRIRLLLPNPCHKFPKFYISEAANKRFQTQTLPQKFFFRIDTS
ncbi:hypothetical protein J6590_001740 [Homalodisca vitripennis]|nr:hypothetical protein J6590_001740 [Homalodisca vitripennis]